MVTQKDVDKSTAKVEKAKAELEKFQSEHYKLVSKFKREQRLARLQAELDAAAAESDE